MKAGWQWMRGNTYSYDSLEEALLHDGLTMNKLFIAENDISWTAAVSGVGSGTAIKLTFAKPVEGLSADDIILSAVSGAAIPGKLTGGGTEWTLAIDEVVHTGEIEVSVSHWGLESKDELVTVDSGTSEASPLDLANWMGGLNDNINICHIAIPGTHDSATAGVWAFREMARCQSKRLSQQLLDGIRYFDIRVDGRASGLYGKYTVLTHGGIICWNSDSTPMTLDDVNKICTNFLSAHPKETILISVKWESLYKGDTDDWGFKTYVPTHIWNSSTYKDRWYVGTTIPTLGAVRGKMVLLRDSGIPSSYGIDPVVFQNDWDSGHWWEVGVIRAGKKIDAMKGATGFFHTMYTAYALPIYTEDMRPKWLFMNFWNHQWNAFYPIDWYSSRINQAMWQGWSYSGWWPFYKGRSFDREPFYFPGIQAMDYYWQENVDWIIFSNIWLQLH
jgi:hypothetical protein